MVGLAFNSHDLAATLGAMLGHSELFVAARMLLVFDHAHHFGDDVAAALDHDPVADLHAQTLDLISVVQRRARDRGPADRNGLERRDGREFTGTADLDKDVFYLSHSGAGRVLISNGPARSAAGEPELFLHCSAVHFDHNAIDLIRSE